MSIYVSFTFDRLNQIFSAGADIYINPYVDPETEEYFDEFSWGSYKDNDLQNSGTGNSGAVGVDAFYVNISTGLHSLEIVSETYFSSEREYWQADLANHTLANSGQYIIGYSETAGSQRIDIALGSEYADKFSLGRNNDYAEGGGGNDIMDGGSGADVLAGGYGDDRFYVDNAGDRILEASNQGNDVVYTTVSFTLAAGQHIELLTTTYPAGTGAINLTGNEVAQRINGNNGNNVIRGGGSSDTLVGYGGNDVLDGGAGVDTLIGGAGDDTYYVDNVLDIVKETAGQGTDKVFTTTNYTLGAGQSIELFGTRLETGTTAINLAGNELAQRINGNDGANTLSGFSGNDTLVGYGGKDWLKGGLGNDTLYGGNGDDYFVFNTTLNASTNVDRIMDFSVPQDTIYLDNAVMAGLGATLGTLSAAKFWKSTSGLAHDPDDRIIYETDTGKLFYDSNGIAAGGALHFATLASNLALTNADFQVI